jgi:Kef-type K+ transport system membrane component KefB
MEFSQIATLLVVAAVAGGVAKLFKQPLLIGYLFAGFILSFFGVVGDVEVFSGLGQIGVALLLFLVGLEMNLNELPTIGRIALYTGLGQILFTSTIGFLIATAFGFETIPSLYFAIALAFSSTIIIVKLLSEKNDLGSLYGKISVGFLLVQDFVAVGILMFLAGLGRGNLGVSDYLFIAGKGLLLMALVWFLSKRFLTVLFDKFLARSQELLFIASIAWALGVASFVAGPVGFTLEIGGFLAGLALSTLPEHLQIASKTRPLRDFFLTIFFILLGTKLVVANLAGVLAPALVFSAFVLVGNPIIVLSILGLLGHKKRTSFLSGLTVAQISEFSLIITAMGVALGHLTESHLAMIILVAVITMTASTYLIFGADRVYVRIKDYLKVFERKSPKEIPMVQEKELQDHVVLIGADRTGSVLIPLLKRKAETFLVVDFNPKIFRVLTADKIPVLFGDITDPEIIELSQVNNAKLVISTTSSLQDNLVLLEQIRMSRKRPMTMFTALVRDDALKLYEAGADYAIVPERIAGDHIRHVLSVYGIGSDRIKKLGKNNFRRLAHR